MSFIPIYATLKANAAVTAAIDVPKKVFEDVAPLGTKEPYIVWQAISGQANNHLDTPANFDDTQYQLMVYASNAKTAYELRDLCRKALENRSWINNPSINQYETDTKLYARGFDANWILER